MITYEVLLADADDNHTAREMTALSPEAVHRMVALMKREGLLPATTEIVAVLPAGT